MQLNKAKTAIESIAPGQVKDSDYSKTGYHLEVILEKEQVVSLAEQMMALGFLIEDVTAVDLKPDMEVVYHYIHTEECCRVLGRTYIPRNAPEVPTISAVFSGANWHERETHDFFGIVFTEHPYLAPLLLPEDANFHPLVKEDGKVKTLKDIKRVEAKEAVSAAS